MLYLYRVCGWSNLDYEPLDYLLTTLALSPLELAKHFVKEQLKRFHLNGHTIYFVYRLQS